MQKILSIICALILALLIPSAILLSRILPADNGRYISEKYDGYCGVLQAWVCCDWEAGGSFISWLNSCAVQFEKQHEGVYLEFTPVSAAAMEGLGENGIRAPELVLFSPGVIRDPSRLAQLGFPEQLRTDLRRDDRAIPVAMDGCIWAVNPDADGGTVCAPENIPGVTGLLGDTADAPAVPEAPGLDLGLPAFARAALQMDENAMDAFLSGKAYRICADGAKLKQLMHLRENGKGPGWQIGSGGSFVCADRLLLLGVSAGQSEETLALCREFAAHLLSDESQDALTIAGAYGVTGRSIYPGQDPRSTADIRIQTLPLAAGDPFSEHSPANAEAIVRSAAALAISPREAAAKFGFSFRLPN